MSEQQPDYQVVDELFATNDKALADWCAANPSLGRPANVVYVNEQLEQALIKSALTTRLADGVRPRQRGAGRAQFILDEIRQFKAMAAEVKFELLEWQEDVVRQWFELDDDMQVLGVLGKHVYFGPVGATPPVFYDECAEPFLSAAAWDKVRRTPRNDGEMLNHVIDEIEQDVEAKIARLQCPRFPRNEA